MRAVRSRETSEHKGRKGEGDALGALRSHPSAGKGTERAVAACLAYVRHTAVVKAATTAIARSLDECPGVAGRRRLGVLHGEGLQFDSTDPTHLGAYYESVKIEPGQGAVLDVPDDVAECPACSRAHRIVQERKAARQDVGKAKRALSLAARTLQAEAGAPSPDEEARQRFLAAQGDLFLGEATRRCPMGCGHEFAESLGPFGCPNCLGEGLQ